MSDAIESNMIRRVTFAVIAIPALIGAVWLGGWALAAVLVLAGTLGTTELFGLAERAGIRPFRELGRVLAAAIPLVMTLLMFTEPSRIWLTDQWGYLPVLGILLVVGAAVFLRTPAQRPLSAIAVTLLAPVYTSLLPSMVYIIRHAQWPARSWQGTAVVFFPLVVTWVCDSAAMFAGQRIGGAKLAPTISPGKTRAGAIAGVLGGCSAGVVFALWIFPRLHVDIDLVPTIILALLISVIGQIGDLAESLIKREAGVKDSSSIIPGHGGVLDRLDSLYFVIPFAAAAYHILGVI